MPKKEDLSDFRLASMPRPHLTAHHSSSLPSTPSQHARKLSFGARSPSPTKIAKENSPKSTHSEDDNGVRSQNKPPSIAGCRYETGMAFSRRRIPYSIGGDQLERAKTMPKKFLNPADEGKLSGDMRELYDRILPTRESDERRARFVRKLERILNQQWPGNDITVHVFGSSGNMLCTNDSDVDICITTPLKILERVCLLANALADHGMERVVCVPHAKVPIVKFWDPELQLACDMNVNNTLALENTRMIKTYVEIDERVRPLAMIVKQWTKRRILNDAALGGTLSSYTWICLILNFLQTRNPPVLPSLHKKPHELQAGSDSRCAGFNDDLERFRGFGKLNNETLGELLFSFFRCYAYDLDYEKWVVSVREGRLISKEGKKWHLMQNNRLCVEEPFNTDRNLGNTADDISFRGIHLELRRAFDLVKEAQLADCLEQYEFPAAEERIWEKPAPKPPPVLSRSRSQSQSSTRGNRGGHGIRGGGRHGQHHRSGQGARRASSAAAMNKYVAPQSGLQGIRGRDYSSREHPLQAQYDQLRLHDRLFNEFQLLQQQEHELRLIQAQRELEAQMAQATHASRNGSLIPHQGAPGQPPPMPKNHQIPLTAPIRSGQYFYPFAYPQVQGTSQPNVHTQPSSPSMKPAQPDLRRSLHRSSAAEIAHAANHRSHSQPARPIPVNVAAQSAPPLPLNSAAFLQYQQFRQQQLYNQIEQGRYRHVEVPMYQDPRRLPMDQPLEEDVPKEYVGYWVNDSPPPRLYRDDPRFPAYQDLHPRVRGVPQNFSRLRDTSRSPSPSPALPFRDRAYSVRSASSAPSGPLQPRMDRVQIAAPGSRASGPLIINGSDEWNMSDYPMIPEASSHTTTISEATSGSDDRLYETPATTEMDTPNHHHGVDDGFVQDDPNQYFHARMTAEPSSTLAKGRVGKIDSIMRRANPPLNDITTSSNTNNRTEKLNRSAGGLGIQFGEHEINRPSVKAEMPISPGAARDPAAASKPDVIPNVQPDLKTDHFIGRTEKLPMPIPVPLLSPVREVRTPSPSAAWRRQIGEAELRRSNGRFAAKLDLRIPTYADLARAKQEKQSLNGTLGQKPNGTSSSQLAESAKSIRSPLSPRTKETPQHTLENAKAQPQVNGWQQSGKKGKKNKSRPSSGQIQILPGEVMPANEAERKGG
ncbi:hypothetical protein HO133_009618 [Letharia lupina]|uniref:polynucleotide adenylyltransferase n=1 Tax=Letharia lupina TaxID=560253 RepID=A0A8H6FF60_9LECA|nr:uncharacterized protein HO133_009618 [Letharia lupina]KAF6225618.1 hypothetical protein HO133_009618 [Letharia lupina]